MNRLIANLYLGGWHDVGMWMHNRLQAAASLLSPCVEKLRRVFAEFDFVAHQLTGSGSAYFGICRHAAARTAFSQYSSHTATGACLRHSQLPIGRAWKRKENDVEITEVRIKLMEEPGERLKAFCSITFDNCFVVRDLKIIDGSNGPFVAMPSRKLTTHCPGCGMKNHLRAQYCNQCGKRMTDARAPKDADGRAKLYADIAHPINSECREMIQEVVVNEFFEEIERAKQPGYVSRYDDFDFEYTDAPRSKPARFDSAHAYPAEQPHMNSRRLRPTPMACRRTIFAAIRRPMAIVRRIRRRRLAARSELEFFPSDVRARRSRISRPTLFLGEPVEQARAVLPVASQISKSSESVPFR